MRRLSNGGLLKIHAAMHVFLCLVEAYPALEIFQPIRAGLNPLAVLGFIPLYASNKRLFTVFMGALKYNRFV